MKSGPAMFKAGNGERKADQFTTIKGPEQDAPCGFQCDREGQRSHINIFECPNLFFQAENGLDILNALQITNADRSLMN